MRRSPILVGGLLLLTGCGPKPVPVPTAPAPTPVVVAPPTVTPPTQAEKPKPDTRDYWRYAGGHFAKGSGEAWYEHNAEAEASRQGKWEFREVARTPEHVDLYDASRAVTVRLTADEMLAKWDKDGREAEWKTLQKGQWGRE